MYIDGHLASNNSHRALMINFSLDFFFDGELLGGGG